MAKDDVPEHIKKYESLKKKAKRILDTMDLSHSKAYTNAAESVLMDKEGNLDYDLLEKEDIQQKFADKMTSHYVDAANKYFGSKLKPEDQFQVDMLLQAYAGTTKSTIENTVKRLGKKYTLTAHEEGKKELLDQAKKSLGASAQSHLKEEHAADFIKYMNLEGLVDSSKVRLGEALGIHSIYEEKGTVTEKMIRDVFGYKPIIMKKKKGEVVPFPGYDSGEARKAA